MSSGRKQAQPVGGRPLDGRVRRHLAGYPRLRQPSQAIALTAAAADLVGEARRTALALRALALKDIGSIRTVHMATVRPHARHAIRHLPIVCSSDTPATCAELI